MPDFNTREVLTITGDDLELKRFLDRLRLAHRILINDGSEQYVVEYQQLQISAAARKILIGGGPESD